MATDKKEIQFVNGYLKELRAEAQPLPEDEMKKIMSVDLDAKDLTPAEIHPLFAEINTTSIEIEIE